MEIGGKRTDVKAVVAYKNCNTRAKGDFFSTPQLHRVLQMKEAVMLVFTWLLSKSDTHNDDLGLLGHVAQDKKPHTEKEVGCSFEQVSGKTYYMKLLTGSSIRKE